MEENERIGRTEAVYREVNEAIAESAGKFDAHAVHLVCECGDVECTERVTVDLATYEAVRAHPTRFILVRGHDEPAVERVIELKDGYAIVEKFEATVTRIVRRLNPRPATD